MAFEGLVKVRLVHAQHGSVILVDQIVLVEEGRQPYWLQPQWIGPPILHFLDDFAIATIWVRGIGVRGTQVDLEIELRADGRVTALDDRSEIYRAKVVASNDPYHHKAGRARLRDDGSFDLRLYHHTTPANKASIASSGEVWGSAWNFQGNKQLANCSYAYFTNLPVIETESDLRRIAMASDGTLPLRLDQSPDWAGPDLVLTVYRESTENRAATVWLWVPAEHVSPAHIFKHSQGQVEYEVAQPCIYRLGLEPAGKYRFVVDQGASEQPDLKRFHYVVLGDCTTLEGLEAPYDEDNTSEIFEVQELGAQSIFEFWRNHGNQPLYSGDVETQEFVVDDDQ